MSESHPNSAQATAQKTAKGSNLLNWLGYIAVTLALALPIAVLTVRAGAWQQGLLLYSLSCAGAAIVLIIFVLMLLLPRYQHLRSDIRKRALWTLPGTLLLGLVLTSGGDYPLIHDITTDTLDPPISSAAEQRGGATRNTQAAAPETIAAQRQSYPDLQTMQTDLSIEEVFSKAKHTAVALGWNIYYENLNDGVIEATDTTAIMAFTDDVIIRLRTNADGTLVDLRSTSRIGKGDMGTNAQRIRKFQQAFSTQ